MATWNLSHVSEAIHRDFPDEDPKTIWAILDEYQRDSPGASRPWLLMAILKMSEGDRDKLLYYTALAIKDWRDVMYWPKAIVPLNPDGAEFVHDLETVTKTIVSRE